MNDLQIFDNAEFGQVRTIEENGQVWFCGKDVAIALGYTNPKKCINDHCKEDGVTIRSLIDSMGREQQAKFINEPNLYRLITHSKLPSAEKFEKWVFEEVLPTIRKTGHYEAPGYAPKATSIGEPWFVGKDIAEALGYSNTKKALIDHVDSEDKQLLQRSQNVTLEIPNRGIAKRRSEKQDVI